MKIDQSWTSRLLQDRLSEVMGQVVCMRVVQLLREQVTNYQDVADALSVDPFLSAKIVGVANLAQGAGRQPIRSIQRALAVLGVRHTHMLMMSIMLTGSIMGGNKNPSVYELTLRRWILSMGIAGDWIGSQNISAGAMLRSDDMDIGTHLIGGLLKGLGPMLLYVGLGREYQQLFGDPPSVLELIYKERQQLGAGHDLVTRWALEEMNCPTELLIGSGDSDDPEITALCDRAIELLAAASCGMDNGPAEAWLEDGLSRLGIDSMELTEGLIQKLQTRVDQLGRLLEIPLAPVPKESWHQQVMMAGRMMESLLVDQVTTEQQLVGNLHRSAVSEIAREVAALQADTDALTGILNRRGIEHAIETLKVSYKGSMGLITLDVDHFKKINDTVGHAGGDDVLRRLGRVLGGITPAPLFCGRMGGDEFVIVVDASDATALQQIVDGILQQTHGAKPGEYPFTISIGALLGDSQEVLSDWDQSIKRADGFLYQAKRDGRNRAVIGGL